LLSSKLECISEPVLDEVLLKGCYIEKVL
jgi:hypothetical protein